MKKLNLKLIADEIRKNEFTTTKRWWLDSIEEIETVDTYYGTLTRYEVIISFSAGKYDDNGMKYQVNHYEDSDTYRVLWDGNTFLA